MEVEVFIDIVTSNGYTVVSIISGCNKIWRYQGLGELDLVTCVTYLETQYYCEWSKHPKPS